MSMSMSMSMSIVEEMNKVMVGLSKKVVVELSEMYNFDGEEAISRLNLDMLNVDVVSKVKSVKSEKVKNVKSEKVKSKYPLPFNNKKNESCCSGLRQNHGLYTQCESAKVKDSEYCKKCSKESLKNVEN